MSPVETRADSGSDVILDRLMTLHPKIMDLTLGRMHRLLARLGHPERDLPPVIHVAGTNGKGSTLAMLRAGIEGAGKTCHVYTSPHLARFHERIRLAGTLISEPALMALLDECESKNGGAQITFFEVTTCAALLAFAREKADYTLLEVGLGGRLDATNVIDRPALTIVTPVSVDHQQYLGDSLAQIAVEKAGIMKPGAICVSAPQQKAALDAIETHAARIGAPLLLGRQDWDARMESGRLVYQDAAGLLDLPPPALPGAHQAANAGCALAALRALGMGDDACRAAMREARWPARMQPLPAAQLPGAPEHAEIWLDGGHNEAAGAALAAHMAMLEDRRPAPLHLICGMLDTKDPSAFLGHFAGLARQVQALSIPDAPATLSAEATAAAARGKGLTAEPASGLRDAFARIAAAGDPAPRVLICGSLYLAGWVLRETAAPLD